MEQVKFNLADLRDPLERALNGYEKYFGGEISFGKFKDFVRTPDKPNYARTVVPLTFQDSIEDNIAVIVFQKGDGTGAFVDFQAGDLIVPQEFVYAEKPERVYPRKKGAHGIICEGYVPLFSESKLLHKFCLYAGSLDELTLTDNREIKRAWKLGQGIFEFPDILCGHDEARPRVYYTVRTHLSGGEPFGDPHAIIYGGNTIAPQVGGFLTIKDEKSPLMSLTKRWILPKGYY